MIVPLVSTLDGMDDSLIEAGYNLGGSRFTVFRRIVVPYAMPGIVAGCIVVFMLTAGSYLTPILLGGKNSMWFTAADLRTSSSPATTGSTARPSACCCSPSPRSTVWLGLRLSGQRLCHHRGAGLSG